MLDILEVMQIHTSASDESSLLYHMFFDSPSRYSNNYRGKFAIEEFGHVAREVMSPMMLVKQFASESSDWEHHEARCKKRTSAQVFLCFNWEKRLPFVVIQNRVEYAESYYTPQYGQNDNYSVRSWNDITHQLYALNELAQLRPEVAALVK